MLKNKYRTLTLLLAVITVPVITSCLDDLNTRPLDDDVTTSANVYESPDDFRQVLAKLYAGFATTGQQGPAGDPDIQGIDEGFSNYTRQLWVAQELPTDEAVVAWNDPGLPEFNFQSWGASNDFVLGMYSRIYFEIALANEFIRNANGRTEETIKEFNAEARFIRALSYWHALDLYGGGVPFVTEEDGVGAFLPEPITAEELFSFIESELLEIEDQLPSAGQNEYGRADRGAIWTLLTKLYLNAEVYIGQDRNSDAVTFANKVIESGAYTLEDSYGDLFLADNHTADGVIFPITFDGVRTKTFGGTTFITHAAVGGNMSVNDFGIDFGWAGHRVTKQFVSKFLDTTKVQNKRASLPTFSFSTQSRPSDEIYVPGGYQAASNYGADWTPEDAPPLFSPADDNTFEGYLFFNTANTQFKLTNERNWDLNWGDDGADKTLEENGANIEAQRSGHHKINVNLNDMTYDTLFIESWGVIGDATADGWNSDQDMTYNPDSLYWETTQDLAAGELKFRANDDWPLNFGDNGADGTLEEGGANIAVSEPGSYKIIMDLSSHPYTYSIALTSFDSRTMFHADGQSLEINDIKEFTEGYAINKWKNITSGGQKGKDPTFVDTDFPMFRLADVYLMYAEATLRGGGGDMSKALTLINNLRERAYGDDSDNITASELDLDFILDERARELYWEGHRRTDLIRYGLFTSGNFVWAWKGGVQEGRATSDHLNVYPIPSSEINSNPNLKQNPGY